MQLISREKLEFTGRRILGYTLHDTEKDYFLALVMNLLSNSSLSKKLVFKGGTAIYHCFLEQLRFSEDLDFTASDRDLSIEDIENLFKNDNEFEVKRPFVSFATLKIEQLKYNGILETPNSIKFEVDKLQNVYLPAVKRKYKNVWDLDFEVQVMDPTEICAEKVRACNERFRYRDFYDLYMLVNDLGIDWDSVVDIIPRKEIRKPTSKANVLKNLSFALEEKHEKADTVVYKKEIDVEVLREFFEGLEIPSLEPNI